MFSPHPSFSVQACLRRVRKLLWGGWVRAVVTDARRNSRKTQIEQQRGKIYTHTKTEVYVQREPRSRAKLKVWTHPYVRSEAVWGGVRSVIKWTTHKWLILRGLKYYPVLFIFPFF